MKKITTLILHMLAGILMLFAAIGAQASPFDKLPQDQMLHLGLSYAAAVTYAPLSERDNPEHPVLNTFVVGMLPGLAKRAWDETQPQFDAQEKNRDMLCNIAGALAGAWVEHGVLMFTGNGFQINKRW